jgi:ribonucleases P/MRP protein subunit RPP40
MVDPKLLFYKPLNYGFGNLALKLVKSYFYNRSQCTKISNITSDLASLLLGVPQGSVLSPLFFLIFINDLPFFLSDIFSTLFADDTLLFSGPDIDKTISLLRVGLKQLNE